MVMPHQVSGRMSRVVNIDLMGGQIPVQQRSFLTIAELLLTGLNAAKCLTSHDGSSGVNCRRREISQMVLFSGRHDDNPMRTSCQSRAQRTDCKRCVDFLGAE